MSEDDPPTENGDGDPREVAESSDTEFLGCRDLSLPLPGVKSLEEQISDNTELMLALLDAAFPDRIEMGRIKRSILARHAARNRRRL
jgi:hypothetical protein